MDAQSRIMQGLQRASNAAQARQQAGQRIEDRRKHSLDQTCAFDARLQCYGTKISPKEIEQAYTQPQQQPQQQQ